MKVEDCFTEPNTISHIEEIENLQKIDILIQAGKAFARITHQCVYVIDFIKHKILYASDKLPLWCGEDAYFTQNQSYHSYLRHIPQEELEMLTEVNRKGFQFFENLPIEERLRYSFFYDFHLINGRIRRLVNHHLTPILLNREGHIWLALCTIAISSNQTPGHILIKKDDSSCVYVYNQEQHEWVKNERMSLSTTEHQVLTLSAQGYTMNDIAYKLSLSIDTIKGCKKRLFAKLNVKNIVEAISYATNYGLIE